MFSLGQFSQLRSSASALRLSRADTGKWLWSYYRSRLPGARNAAEKCLTVKAKPSGFPQMTVCIRMNGADYVPVEEILLGNTYPGIDGEICTILDLGGNIGMASLLFSTRYPAAQICTVEPIPQNLEILNNNMSLNRVRTVVVPAAVAAQDGRTTFRLSSDPQQHAMLKEGAAVQPSQGVVEVETISVPSLMARMGWQTIDMLKIDIEGGECEVLGGRPEWLNRVRTIVGEGHLGAGYDMDRCRADLEPMGFEVAEIGRTSGSILFLGTRAPRQ
jgi:FkbM family methyltransferase